MQPAEQDSAGRDRLTEVRVSARGWHSVQIAALGFIGLCGVLQRGGGEGNPRWLQILAGLLVLAALVLSCAAVVIVAAAAWPVYGRAAQQRAGNDTVDEEIRRTSRRLRVGIVMTFASVAVLALASTSSWWPRRGAPASQLTEVTSGRGVICGTLLPAENGSLAMQVGSQRLGLALAEVVSVRPVERCP